MYHVQSRWPLLGQQIGRDMQLKNVLTGRKKRGTRAIPHTKSRRVEEGMLQNNGNNQLAEGEKLGLLYFKQKIQLSVERRGMLVKSQITYLKNTYSRLCYNIFLHG